MGWSRAETSLLRGALIGPTRMGVLVVVVQFDDITDANTVKLSLGYAADVNFAR